MSVIEWFILFSILFAVVVCLDERAGGAREREKE